LFRERDGIEEQTNLLPSTFRLSEGVWHRLEVRQRLSVTDGLASNELYVDGALIGRSTNHNYYGEPVNWLRYGIVAIDRVKQTNPLTVSFDSPFAQVTDGTGPAAVEGLSAREPTATSVPLSWRPPADNIDVARYEIWRGDATWSSWTLAGQVSGDVTRFTASGLAPGTGYTFGVRAFDAAGNKSAPGSGLAVTTPPDTTAPTAASGLVAGQPTPTSVRLTWRPSTDDVGVAQYRIWSWTSATGWRLATTVAGDATSVEVDGLEPDADHWFGLRTFDAAGNESAASNLVGVRTPG
jgi:hypothetical protein